MTNFKSGKGVHELMKVSRPDCGNSFLQKSTSSDNDKKGSGKFQTPHPTGSPVPVHEVLSTSLSNSITNSLTI